MLNLLPLSSGDLDDGVEVLQFGWFVIQSTALSGRAFKRIQIVGAQPEHCLVFFQRTLEMLAAIEASNIISKPLCLVTSSTKKMARNLTVLYVLSFDGKRAQLRGELVNRCSEFPRLVPQAYPAEEAN